MITHEEIIEISKHYNLNINQSSTIERYVKQNQLRDKRAKKVEELLGLYQKSSHYQIGHNLDCLSIDDKKKWIEIEKQIKQLEKELESLK